ncbi:MAG: 3D-(3,5/4)-trihydroxycyclohexane-1,2-dione acylhydrolase (decyclizing), partial [Rhodobacteraceae bacterium]|nr:3D-(3,5/4)-trihydroxycyclohexane-1,2-dione acylhydrolase (decyclizing) [Paracoccaceae bacterium]
ALPRALQTMTDPAKCGPVTLSFCQDVQAEAYDYPVSFFEPKVWRTRRPEPDAVELAEVIDTIKAAKRPMIIAGGGVIYSDAEETFLRFARDHNIPFAETQAGKGAVDWEDSLNLGAPGVTGGDAANIALGAADVVIGVGTRLQDFTTGSWSVFANPEHKLISINVTAYDAGKHGAMSLVSDAKVALEKISAALGDQSWPDHDSSARAAWYEATDALMASPNTAGLPTDAQVIGAVQRQALPNTVAMCAAGTMPGALHTLWRSAQGGYHMEYGFSCMGYELAGAMGVKLARPDADVVCFIGDGSYMMANSELATAVMRRIPYVVVMSDNRGFGCINRLQKATGGAEFNNLYTSVNTETQPDIDFVAHAASMGAHAERAADIAELEAKIVEARSRDIPSVIVIETDPYPGTGAGGSWWDVAVPEVSDREEVRAARATYAEQIARLRAN